MNNEYTPQDELIQQDGLNNISNSLKDSFNTKLNTDKDTRMDEEDQDFNDKEVNEEYESDFQNESEYDPEVESTHAAEINEANEANEDEEQKEINDPQDDPTFDPNEDSNNEIEDDSFVPQSSKKKLSNGKKKKQIKKDVKASKKESKTKKNDNISKKSLKRKKDEIDSSSDLEYEGIEMFSYYKELEHGSFRLLSRGIESYSPPSYNAYNQLQLVEENLSANEKSVFELQESLSEKEIIDNLCGMWEIAYICFVCKVLRPLLKFMHFDPSQLERALVYPDEKENADLLADIHIRLSKGPVIDKRSREILLEPGNGQWVSVLKNKLDYMQQNTPNIIFWKVNPLKTCSYGNLSPFIRVLLLKSLCDWKLINKTQRFVDLLKKIEDPNEFRMQPLAYAKDGSMYWYFGPEVGRLYLEKYPKSGKSGKWQVVCDSIDSFKKFQEKHNNTDDSGIKLVVDNIENYIIQDIIAYQEERDRKNKERLQKIEEKLKAREFEQEKEEEEDANGIAEDEKSEDNTEELRQKMKNEREARKKAREEQKKLILLQEEQGKNPYFTKSTKDDEEDEYDEDEPPKKKRKKNDDDEFVPEDFEDEEEEDEDDDLYEEEEEEYEEHIEKRSNNIRKIGARGGNQNPMFAQFQIYQPNQKKGSFVPLPGFQMSQPIHVQTSSGSQHIHPLPRDVFARLTQNVNRNQNVSSMPTINMNGINGMGTMNSFMNQQRMSQHFPSNSNFIGNSQTAQSGNQGSPFLGNPQFILQGQLQQGNLGQNTLPSNQIQQGLNQNPSTLQGDQSRNYLQQFLQNNQQMQFPFSIPSFGNNMSPQKGGLVNPHIHSGLNGNQQIGQISPNQLNSGQLNSNQITTTQIGQNQLNQNVIQYNQQMQLMRQMQQRQQQMVPNNFQNAPFLISPQMQSPQQMNQQIGQKQIMTGFNQTFDSTFGHSPSPQGSNQNQNQEDEFY